MRTHVARIAAVAALAIVAAGCAASARSDGVTDGPGGLGAVVLVAKDGKFVPRMLRFTAGETAKVEFKNSDDQPHDFVVNSAGLDTGLIEPGETVTARFTPPQRGARFVCTIHPDMKGTIAITKKGATS